MEIHGVLLAAGTGSRFADGNKLLADLDGEPLVRHAAETVLRAAEDGVVDTLVVVLGHESDRIGAALADMPFDDVRNPDYERGQATSVGRGARAVRERGADAGVFALGDMPCVDPSTVATVAAGLDDGDAAIAVPIHDGRRGNPVAFGAEHFEALAAVDGDTGGRNLIGRNPVNRVPVDDPGIHRDVDTVDDLAGLRERCD